MCLFVLCRWIARSRAITALAAPQVGREEGEIDDFVIVADQMPDRAQKWAGWVVNSTAGCMGAKREQIDVLICMHNRNRAGRVERLDLSDGARCAFVVFGVSSR